MFSFLKSFASIRTLSLGAVALLAVSNVHAGITLVAPTPHATEASTEQILSHQYGGSFSALGNGFTNGSITATRIDDLNDVAWKGDLMTLNAVASFSRSQQSVGLLLGKSGGDYEHLFSVNQFGYLPAAATTVDTSGEFFRFVLDNSGTNLRSSSLNTENAFGDQLVTYRIDGLEKGSSRYLLFWSRRASPATAAPPPSLCPRPSGAGSWSWAAWRRSCITRNASSFRRLNGHSVDTSLT